MNKLSGRVTLPAETGQEALVRELIDRWGVDAIRDSDGTQLSPDILEMDIAIYSTICLVRAEQNWPRAHPEHLPQMYLMTPRQTFTGSPLKFDLMSDWCSEKYRLNDDDEPAKWWDVIDRTTGEFLTSNQWDYLAGVVTINDGIAFHEYTVNFLVYQTWDSTSMYNAMVNNWTGPKVMSVDPFDEAVYAHLMDYFDHWLSDHPQTDVVRLTTLAFGFMLVRDNRQRCSIRDWCGYSEAVTPAALRAFEQAKGYRLRGEDFVQAGSYAHTNLPPTDKMLHWMDFIEDFVIRFGKDLIKKIHTADKKAAMFWGDHWIGAEPFSYRFFEMGFDMIVGAAEDGNALRRVADLPHDLRRELRLYPYFFPDVFKPGAKPQEESHNNWMKIRRALLRRPVDRIGWGGYLSLAARFPQFIDHLTEITEQFSEFHSQTQGSLPYTAPIRVGVLNAWGALRSWMVQTGPIEKFYSGREDVMEFIGSNICECLAGMPVEVEFFNFRQIIDDPDYLQRFDVIINEGAIGSAWSGGDAWKNPAVVTPLRQWVYAGGGFIGIGHPSACQHQGRVFQLADVLGVELEQGQSVQILSETGRTAQEHFITADLTLPMQVINQHSYAFCIDDAAEILNIRDKHVHLACKAAGKGRGVYLSSVPFNNANARLLQRAIFWSAQKEDFLSRNFSSNQNTDAAWFPEVARFCVINNSTSTQKTDLFNHKGDWFKTLTLQAGEIKWLVCDYPRGT